VVIGVLDGDVLVRPAVACGGCRGACGVAAAAGEGCTLRVALAAGGAVPAPGSVVALATSANELSRRTRELYGVPLAGLLAGAIGASLLGGGEPVIALGAAAGLAAAMTYLRLRPPRPPAFELIDEQRT
jgi:positive regulator of sigma E activity